MDEKIEVTPTGTTVRAVAPDLITVPRMRRISWGAIVAGAVIVIIIQVLLSMLGLGIGLASIEPQEEIYDFEAVGYAAAAWAIGTALISVFLGGFVAGRLAGVPNRLDGMIHGILAWGLATLVIIYLVATLTGTVLGGAFRVLGVGIESAGQAATTVAPKAIQEMQKEIQEQVQKISKPAAEEPGMAWNQVQERAAKLVEENARPAPPPPAPALEPLTTETTEPMLAPTPTPAPPAGPTQEETQDNLMAALDQLLRQEGADRTKAREQAIEALTAGTTLTREQAAQEIDHLEADYRPPETQTEKIGSWRNNARNAAARQKAREVQDLIDSEAARRTAGQAAQLSAVAALWAFIILMLGLIFAGIGGSIGSPRDMIIERF